MLLIFNLIILCLSTDFNFFYDFFFLLETVEDLPGDAEEQLLKKTVIHPFKTNVLTVNCTVAYMAQCTSLNKCNIACQSMGATSNRWFNDGCCECIGSTCINYGINESRCLHCPEENEDDFHHRYDDYGQDDDEFTGDETD